MYSGPQRVSPLGAHLPDPVQAVRREILEEAGLDVEVVPTTPGLDLRYPEQVQPPYTIMVEDIDDPADGFHQHIDLIYFCRSVSSPESLRRGWLWVPRRELEARTPLAVAVGELAAPPDDVRVLGMQAIDVVGDRSPS